MSDESTMYMGATVVIGALLAVAAKFLGGSKGESEDVNPPKSEPKEKKKAKKKGAKSSAAGKKPAAQKAKAAPAPAPAPQPKEVAPAQAPAPASPSKKKKKKGGGGGGGAAPAAAAAATATATPAPVANGGGKSKKKRKGGAGATAPVAAAATNGGSSEASAAAVAAAAEEAEVAAARAAAAAAAEAAAAEMAWETVTVKKRKPMSAPSNEDATTEVDGGKATLTLEIGDFAPSILGPKGTRVQQIQTTSGAKIDLDKATKTCIISGAPDEVASAKEQVMEIIGSQRKATVEMGAKRGLVFGPGGETVRRIQNESGARIELGDRSSTTATLSGKDSAVEAARQAILAILNNSNVGQLVLEDKDRPAVIGKGGANIRLLQEQSGAIIDLGEENVCTVTGEAAQVAKAQELIKLFIEHRGPPPESAETISVPLDHGRLIIGTKGANVTMLQNKSGARINISHGSTESTISVSGDTSKVKACLADIKQLIADNSHKTSVALSQPNLIKAIIGEKGATINGIRDASGARVEIVQTADSSSVSMTGTKAQIAKAKAMVDKAIATELGPPEIPAGQVQHSADMGGATGKVIGASGSNITRLEKEHGVRVVIKNSTMVYVTGPAEGVAGVKKEMDETLQRHDELLERARKQQEEQEKFASADENLDLDINSSSYSGWDVPALEGSWGSSAVASGTAVEPTSTATPSPAKATTNGGGDAWGAPAPPTNAW